MSDDLVEWLRAQLDADQEIAKVAIQGPWRTGAIAEHLVDDVIYGTSPYAHSGPGGDKIVQVANLEMAWEKKQNAAHITRWDPSRVLREVEAKRKILDLTDRMAADAADILADSDALDPSEALTLGATARDLRHWLAAIYSDRPGYQEEWRP